MSSPPARIPEWTYYWSHQAFVSLVLILVFFLGGFLLARLLWAGNRKTSVVLAAENEGLRHRCAELENEDHPEPKKAGAGLNLELDPHS